MKRWWKLSAAVVSILWTVGCGSHEDKSLSYQMNENGCDTQLQSFASQADLCAGLQNEALNHGCAATMRQQQFAADCPGLTWTPS